VKSGRDAADQHYFVRGSRTDVAGIVCAANVGSSKAGGSHFMFADRAQLVLMGVCAVLREFRVVSFGVASDVPVLVVVGSQQEPSG